MKRLSWIIWWAQCNHKDPISMEEGELNDLLESAFCWNGGDHTLRNTGSLEN